LQYEVVQEDEDEDKDEHFIFLHFQSGKDGWLQDHQRRRRRPSKKEAKGVCDEGAPKYSTN